MAATNKVLPVKSIVSKKGFNSRFIFNQEKIDELKRSILSKGLVYPITVKSVKLTKNNISDYETWQDGEKTIVSNTLINQDNIYVLIDGERRWRCHIKLIEEGHEIRGIKTSIEANTLKDDDALLTSFLKNTGENFAPLEEASLFEKLINVYNWTVEDVSNSTGKSVGTIKSRLNLLDSSGKSLQEAINKKNITLEIAEEIIKLSDGDLQKQKELINKEIDTSSVSITKKAEKELKLRKKYNESPETEVKQIDPMDTDEDSIPEEKDKSVEIESEIIEDNTSYVPRTIKFPDKKVLDFEEWKSNYDNLISDIKESIEYKKNKNYLSYSYGMICKLAEVLDLDVEDDLGQDNIDTCENLMN